MLKVTIDGRTWEAEEDMTVLQVAKAHDIRIPTLCYHPALRPSGSCRLCAVEVASRSTGQPITMLACVLRVKDGMQIQTQGKEVQRARTKAFKSLLQMAPQAQSIVNLARSYDIDPGPPPDGCIRCHLCIRVCKEIVGPGALKMEKRDGRNYVVPLEGLCIGCGTCANICPTQVIRVEDRENIRTISIRDEVIGKHPLERCEGCGRLYATPRFLDHIHRRTASHTDVKSFHNYCPTCAKLFSDRIKSQSARPRK
ncbi:MAG: (2Fe-2S)-binding protein [Desulfobacterales bacterium]|nr:MAG: (2Fe-2S)-binding protein [Desulfobacterales bacterium]